MIKCSFKIETVQFLQIGYRHKAEVHRFACSNRIIYLKAFLDALWGLSRIGVKKKKKLSKLPFLGEKSFSLEIVHDGYGKIIKNVSCHGEKINLKTYCIFKKIKN